MLLGAVALWVTAPLAFPSVAAPGPSGPCAAGLGVGLVDVPVTNDPRAQTYIVDHVKAGARFTRRFQVCNGTRSPVTVALYSGAAEVKGGAFTIVEGRAHNELSDWILVSPARVTLRPGQRVLATAALAIPRTAEPGERYAVLLAELPPKPRGDGVAVAGRVGVRVYLDVGAKGDPRTDFTIDSMQAGRRGDGAAVVTALVHNTGGRALDLAGSLALRDGPGGLSGGPFPAQLGTTLGPGQTEPVTVPLDKAIRGGPWTAHLTLRSGLTERRAEAHLTFPDEAGRSETPVKAKNLPLAKDRKVLIPLAGGLIGLLLLVLLVLGYLTSRRKAKEKQTQ